jgi:hypothetical protein
MESSLSAPPLLTITGEVPEDLLRRYEGVFATPVGLPLVQPHSHQIRLLPGMTSVVVWRYRYMHL